MPERFRLTDYQYAHRGLWSETLPENSSAAFQAAAENRFGIECDVHLSSDGVPFVFHDFTLERMTNSTGRIGDTSASDLKALRLAETDETIPTLSETLSVMGDLPVLTELKCEDSTDRDALAKAVITLTASHTGPVTLMSFDRALVSKVRRLAPDVMLGSLIDPRHELNVENLIEFIISSQIDYLGPNIKDIALISDISEMLGLQTTTWTVRTEGDLRRAYENKAAPIFEKLDPALVRRPGSS